MKMKNIKYILIAFVITLFYGCVDDLNQYPHIEETSESVYSKAENYLPALAKCYASFVTEGQEKGGGNADLSSNNGYDYMRNYFNLQQAGTDEIASTWIEGDNIGDLTFLTWDNQDPWIADMYYRAYYSISLCNEFLKNSTDDKISGFTESQQSEIRSYRAEARFLRAMAYYHAMDLFHNIPFADEDLIGSSKLPEKKTAAEIFAFIESELIEAGEELADAASCEYGHASRGAAWTLLARMYLNAETYGVGNKLEECMTYSQKVIDEGYQLEEDYAKLFNADNHKRVGVGHEIIFPLVVDSESVMSWGATTYLACGQVDTDEGPDALSLGISNAWSMFRVRGNFSALFDLDDGNKSSGDRALLDKGDNTQFMPNGVTDRKGGYFVTKWSNLTDDGAIASNTEVDGVDIDFPMFRLADVYLMYAEAAVRSNVNVAQALDYVNELREKRNADTVTENDITKTVDGIPYKFFLDERARELYWETVRRTDLIRFDSFTSDKYLWEWKGGVKDGVKVDDRYNVYPIPHTELNANPNMDVSNEKDS